MVLDVIRHSKNGLPVYGNLGFKKAVSVVTANVRIHHQATVRILRMAHQEFEITHVEPS